MNNCPVCQNPQLASYKKAGKHYPLKICPKCRLVFNGGKVKKAGDVYTENYYTSKKIKGGYFNYVEEAAVNKLTFKHRLKKISQKTDPQKSLLLDLGCALGDFLEVCRDTLWENALGTDVSSFAVKKCRDKGLRVYHAKSRQTKEVLKENSFDVVTLQDVLEHFPDPKKEVEKIYQLLKPGGLLFMSTPDIGSFSAKAMGKYWYHYKEAEHLFYFNRKNIKQMLNNLGFTEIEVHSTPSWVTAEYLIHRLQYYLPNLSRGILNKIFNNPLAHIAFPVPAGEMEVWAKKPSK